MNLSDYTFLYVFGVNFVIYSVIGWCCEVAFAALKEGRFVNRGFLFGPYCPIYGFGVSFVLSCLNPIKDNFIILFLGSFLLTSVLEFITGYCLEKLFHQRWWDYSNEKFNIKGYVCLRFSVMWGLACLIVVDIVHPSIERLISYIPVNAGIIVLALCIAVYISDFIATVIGINNMSKYMKLLKQTAEHLNNISSSMGENISDSTLALAKNANNIKDSIKTKNEKLKQQREKLIERYAESAKNKPFTVRRIQSAFPDLSKLESDIKKLITEKHNRSLK